MARSWSTHIVNHVLWQLLGLPALSVGPRPSTQASAVLCHKRESVQVQVLQVMPCGHKVRSPRFGMDLSAMAGGCGNRGGYRRDR